MYYSAALSQLKQPAACSSAGGGRGEASSREDTVEARRPAVSPRKFALAFPFLSTHLRRRCYFDACFPSVVSPVIQSTRIASSQCDMAVDCCAVPSALPPAAAEDNKGAGELRDVPAETIVQLRSKLLDNSLPLPARYRALYSLRNAKGDQASGALRDALDLDEVPSALLRHDVAFCLGQRQDPAAIAALVRTPSRIAVPHRLLRRPMPACFQGPCSA